MRFDSPHRVVESLAVKDLLNQVCVPEEDDHELPVESLVESAGEHLLEDVVHDVVEEVVEREREEEVL